MGFDKTVTARIFGVTTQNSDLRMPLVGNSVSGTFTGGVNPLRGTKVWDRAMYILKKVAVAGGATGGSYSITLETDAVIGYTGLPIARVTGVGPNSAANIILTNLHQSPGSPLPTHVFIDQTAAGGGITCEGHVIAKQYRGVLGTPGGTAERVLEGTMIQCNANGPFSDGRGMTEDATFTLGTSGTNLGMNRMRLWDNAFFWAVQGVSADGTHDVDIVATVDGTTFSIASTGSAALDIAGDSTSYRVALANNFYGLCPNPTQIIWTEVGAGGVSDARVVMLAKSGRGSLAKS